MGGNADTVKSLWEAFSRQDMDAATADFDQSAEIRIPDTLPWGGTYHGPEGFKEMIGKFTSNLKDFRPTPEAFLEDGDYVAVPLDVQGHTTTGNDFSGRALWLYKLKEGRIVRAEIFADTARAREAVGG